MIRYSLNCEHDHEFEAWFAASGDFDVQVARGLVECPFCASRAVRKAIMAPAIHGAKKRSLTEASAPDPAQTMVMQAMQQMREHVEENFDYMGDAFAKEARAIHDGDSENRGIYGEATPKEVRDLKEDGIQVAPLPAGRYAQAQEQGQLKRRGLWPPMRDRDQADAETPAVQSRPDAERQDVGAILRALTPREGLMLFTAGWLGGQGALDLIGRYASWPERLAGAAELAAAVLWFVPRFRQAGFGAMLAVLAVAALHAFLAGQVPGALIFYAAVVLYLALEEERSKPPRG